MYYTVIGPNVTGGGGGGVVFCWHIEMFCGFKVLAAPTTARQRDTRAATLGSDTVLNSKAIRRCETVAVLF
jgi:hypothetical protein